MNVRQINKSDAENLAKLIKKVDETSQYMLWEADERKIDTSQMIGSIMAKENATILVAEKDYDLAGYLLAIGGNARRNKHTAYLVIGILEEYRGKGIGTLLFRELEKWANDHNLHRLELTVVTKNKAGISLYKKMGFEIEGTKRHSLCINGEYYDEYYMARISSHIK